ncbi:MAG: hypothetical protein QGG40_02570, partial [Myxococcota bacterium]|nr:hypothetical protein [Myxococcota bacterium]
MPYKLTQLAGDLEFHPHRWTLDFWSRIEKPRSMRSPEAKLEVVAHIPEGGQLELFPASRVGGTQPGVGLVLDRIGGAHSRIVLDTGQQRQMLDCQGTLDAPDGTGTPVTVTVGGGAVQARVGQSRTRCSTPGVVTGEVIVIRSGLRRVGFSQLHDGENHYDGPGPAHRWLWWVIGALTTSVVVGLELSTGARSSLVTWTTLPLVLAALGAGTDLRLWAETARVTWLPVPYLGALLPLIVTLTLKILHQLGRQLRETGSRESSAPGHRIGLAVASVGAAAAVAAVSSSPIPAFLVALIFALLFTVSITRILGLLGSMTPNRSATWIAAAGAMGAVGISCLHPLSASGSVFGGCAAVTIATLTWTQVNASRVRGYNLVSLCLACLLVGMVENTVRFTPAGIAWSGKGARTTADDIYGWVPDVQEDFALLEAGQHTRYPYRGYPVAIESEDDRTRIVVVGGSTTGGAYQNDD